MDRVAAELGIDPLEYRARNLLETGDQNPTGETLRPCQTESVLRSPVEELRAIDPESAFPEYTGEEWELGTGFAYGSKAVPQGVTEVRLDIDSAGDLTARVETPAVVESVCDVLTVERQVLGRFQPDTPDLFTPEQFPVSAVTTAEAQYSASPAHGAPGVKLARVNHLSETVDADEVATEVTAEEEAVLRWFGDRLLAGGTEPTMRLETCLYTNTPDGRFVVDTHPEHSQVCFAAGLSGHGYKFRPVIGEILADLALDGDTDHDVDPFGLDRF